MRRFIEIDIMENEEVAQCLSRLDAELMKLAHSNSLLGKLKSTLEENKTSFRINATLRIEFDSILTGEPTLPVDIPVLPEDIPAQEDQPSRKSLEASFDEIIKDEDLPFNN